MILSLKLFFKRVHLHGIAHIPKDKPVILASNHPNAFMDAIILGALLDRELHFLVRGDVFQKKWSSWILGKMNQLPVYRREEGMQNVPKNLHTFERSHEILRKGGMILIFSEGLCIQEKRLRKLRKGTARLAFGAEESNDFNLDLHIVPVGLNYTSPNKARTEAMINFAPPIAVSDFQQGYNENKARAINQLTSTIANALRKEVVHIDNNGAEAAAEQLLVINNNEHPGDASSWHSKSKQRFLNDWNTGEKVNALYASSDWPSLQSSLEAYTQNLQQHNISDEAVAGNVPFTTAKAIGLVAGAPLFLVGILLNHLPVWLGKNIADTRVRDIEFYSSVWVTTAAITYFLVFYPAICITALLINYWIGLGLLVLMIPLYFFSIHYLDWWSDWRKQQRYHKAIKKHPVLKEQLAQQRLALLQMFA